MRYNCNTSHTSDAFTKHIKQCVSGKAQHLQKQCDEWNVNDDTKVEFAQVITYHHPPPRDRCIFLPSIDPKIKNNIIMLPENKRIMIKQL